MSLPGGNAGRGEEKVKVEEATGTRSKEEDNHGWISIQGTARRGNHERTTLGVTRHRISLALISEAPGNAKMATVADGAMIPM